MSARGRRAARFLLAVMVPGLFVLLGLSACEQAPGVSAIAFPGAPGSAQARLTRDVDGAPVLSWLEPAGDDRVLRFARYDGADFGAVQEVVRSSRMFINWADFPSVTPISETLWFAHWLRQRPEGLAYDVATAISKDGGRSWTEAEQMNEDEAEAEHGFASVFAWNGEIASFWLDGRELAEWSFDEPDALLGTSLRLATYGIDGKVTGRRIVDPLVCDCCQPDVAIGSAGPIAIYRDRSEAEVRDVVVRRFDSGEWTAPLNLGNESWTIAGCPVNGPVIAAQGRHVAAAWFTAADGRSRVRFARSADGGLSFASAFDLDSGRVLGQPGIVLDDGGRAVVSWWRRGEAGGIDLVVAAVERDGELSEQLTVAHETIGQVIDVPQIVPAGRGYLVAWTTLDGDGGIRLARVSR